MMQTIFRRFPLVFHVASQRLRAYLNPCPPPRDGTYPNLASQQPCFTQKQFSLEASSLGPSVVRSRS